MKPQPQGHPFDNTYQEDIKPAFLLDNKPKSLSQHQDGDNMTYSEKEALRQLPEASNWPKFSGVGEYYHMKLIDYIYGHFIDVPSISDYWITARLNKEVKGHASIWYTEMKKLNGRENWPWLAREYLDIHFPNLEKKLFPPKEKSFASASGKMKYIGIIIKEMIILHRKGNIRINLDSKLTSKQKLRENRPAFEISEEPLGKIRGHDIELYLDVERPYPLMLRRPLYPESLETRKEIEKHINEILDMDVIKKIGHNKIVEITTAVLITCHDRKYRLCGDFTDLNNYAKADMYPIPRIPHSLDKLEKAKYKNKMDCMKGFHQNGVEPNSMKILRIICHMGIYEYTRMPFGTKNATAHFQRMMDTIFQEEILEGWMVVHIYDIIIYSERLEDH
ncbi:hypothetical protein O181_102009 [Austropuccinia psidii MF-1]|uniref:Reverse transcriptase domain-containing protein n=1 Tax=Austropuccinia psidii MF-1 TaxID=1389203 RepID=A0A9Q3PHV4_9BASI|nr:hypothetical protein [Austropuccinia psidii MF-1]